MRKLKQLWPGSQCSPEIMLESHCLVAPSCQRTVIVGSVICCDNDQTSRLNPKLQRNAVFNVPSSRLHVQHVVQPCYRQACDQPWKGGQSQSAKLVTIHTIIISNHPDGTPSHSKYHWNMFVAEITHTSNSITASSRNMGNENLWSQM